MTYHVACHQRVDYPEPARDVYFDDPAPLPPVAPPLEVPDEPPAEALPEEEPQATDMPPVDPVPIPAATPEPDDTPDEMDLPPVPADDPAPALRQNQRSRATHCPNRRRPVRTHRRVTRQRTVVAVRLSDYIRTR